MPDRDRDRLAIAERVRQELAIENELSRPQARAFVRCLQATWQVPVIQWSDRDSSRQLADARRLLHAAHIFRATSGPSSPGAIDCYRRTGELLEWLSRADDQLRTVVPIELLAAGAYQLGGLPAMASGLLARMSTDQDGVALFSAFLQADFDEVILRAADFWARNPDLTGPDKGMLLASTLVEEEEQDDDRIVRYFTVEMVRCLGLVADCLRRGDDDRLRQALTKLRALDHMAARTFSDDASLVLSLIRDVADGFAKASIYRPLQALAELNRERTPQLMAYARDQFSRGRGILWTSQLHGLDRLIKENSFALCTPTGSGKTLVANMALIKELLLRSSDNPVGRLALYIVPSRALAGEVEAKLTAELGRDIIVTGLYGGTDWGITDYWLTSEQPVVLIATVEKADSLMRYLGPLLLARLRLLIVDEAHQVVPEANEATRVSFSDHSNRAIRLEGLVSRIVAQAPEVVRIALTAVAGGAAGPVARWVEGRPDAKAIGVHYRSTRQLIGILETAPGSQGRILLDLMNGRTLYLRGRDDAVSLPLRMDPMPRLRAAWRNSLNRFNCLSVLWTALHLVEEEQRILVSVAQEPEQTMRWYKEALELDVWAAAVRFTPPTGDSRARFDEARAACLDYCGQHSFELFLLDRGIATSHGQMPQRIRRLMTEMIDRRICPITVATATLTEGVNLPFDLIFVTSLKRRSWDSVAEMPVVAPLTTSEFRNLAGRAGRPGASRGIEGMTLIALPAQISTTANSARPTQQQQQRELTEDYERLRTTLLLEERDADDVASPLALLLREIRGQALRLLGIPPDDFMNWLEVTAPVAISASAGTGATDERSRLADAMDELDALLLTALEDVGRLEEAGLTRARAEERLAALWRLTFTSAAAAQEAWLERAFVQRGVGVVDHLYSDPTERRRLYRYGLTPTIGRRFEAIAVAIRDLIAKSGDYGSIGPTQRVGVFGNIGALLRNDRGFGFRVRRTGTDALILAQWPAVLGWWLNEPGMAGPDADQLRAWQRFVADNLEFRLGVAIGAVVAQAWAEGASDPLTVPSLADWRATTGLPWFGFWARELLRWGTHDPFVAFCLAQGLASTRENAAVRRPSFDDWLGDELENPEPDDRIDPQLFLRWQQSLRRAGSDAPPAFTVDAVLTGTDGRRGRYSVVPVARDGHLAWLDPAGFELAITRPAPIFGPRRRRDDYELDATGKAVTVTRRFPPT